MASSHHVTAVQERRQDSRATVCWKAAVGRLDDIDLVLARTRNVSLGGICVRGSFVAVPGDDVVLLVSMKDRTIPVVAMIVATQLLEDEAELRLKFSSLTPAGRAALERWVIPRVTR
ncbi:MAG: PilZ domain-containing protein [Acidimicrobiales bacterium]